MELLEFLERCEADSTEKANKMRSSRQWWAFVHYALTICAATLAAVAGVGGLSDLLGKTAAAWLALASAVASATSLSLKAKDRANDYAQAENLFRSLALDAAKILAKARDTEPRDPRKEKEWLDWLSSEVDRFETAAKDSWQRAVPIVAAPLTVDRTEIPPPLAPEPTRTDEKDRSRQGERLPRTVPPEPTRTDEKDRPRQEERLPGTLQLKGVRKVHRMLVDLGAEDQPFQGTLTVGRLSVTSVLRWEGQILALVDMHKLGSRFEDPDEFFRGLKMVKERMPDVNWLLFVFSRAKTQEEADGISHWRSWGIWSEALPRVREISDRDNQENLVAALKPRGR
jgi:hypothetical protein